jgi:glycosyltransferase involved in cell wall biosynthesis
VTVTVAIPVRDGGAGLARTLAAVRAQRLERAVELLVCDSGSRDGSVAVARRYGAEVIEIAPTSFSHGGTRNLLMERASGDHVAFLTQDAMPADELWLARLLEGFAVAEDVGLVFGPYRARADASPMVARELTEWFDGFLDGAGRRRVDRLGAGERDVPVLALLGPRGFFTDANGCVARTAWESVPFRPVPYAEDHVLAHDMLRAGYAKVYVPDAAVIHSHEYSRWGWLRRSFDESRALREVYGFVEPLGVRRTALKVWGLVGADWRFARGGGGASGGGGGSAAGGSGGGAPPRPVALLARSTTYHVARVTGAVLGSRADRLPRAVARRLSLEGR